MAIELSEIERSAEFEGNKRKALKSLSSEAVNALGLESVRDRMFKDSVEGKFYAQIEGETAEIRIDGDIEEWTMWKVKSFLRENSGAKKIRVRLNSPGGNAAAGLAIYHVLRNYPAKIETCADGIVASAAAMIFLAGDERLMPEEGSANWMMHFTSTLFLSVAFGNKNRLKKEEPKKELDAVVQSLNAVDEGVITTMKLRTNLKQEEIEKVLESEYYYTGPEAVKAGIATGLYTPEPLSEPDQTPVSYTHLTLPTILLV